MSEFWSKKLGAPAPVQPAVPTPPPWWADSQPVPQYQPPTQYQGQQYSPALAAQMNQNTPMAGHPSHDQYIAQLRKIPSGDLTQEQMEEIAEWELSHVSKMTERCPRCGSGNVMKSPPSRYGSASDRCFDCNYSSYGPDMQPATSGTPRGGSTAARQIDAGGAVKSMYLKVGDGKGIPANYVPRGA